MGSLDKKQQARLRRKKRIRKKICGTSERPRLCVYRSARHIYAQIIDDGAGRTLVTASSLESTVLPPDADAAAAKKVHRAVGVGKLVGQRAMDKGIRQVVFDRNGFLYHGRVKAVSDGAREAGLDF